MEKPVDLAWVTAGEPPHGPNDVSNQMRHVVHGTDDAAVDRLCQPHIMGVDGAECVPGKSISVERSDNLSKHEPTRWPQIAHSDVEGERRVQGRGLNQEYTLSAF